MGFLDSIFGEDKPVPTATPNVKTPLKKSEPVETLTPHVIPTATPVVEDKNYVSAAEDIAFDRLKQLEGWHAKGINIGKEKEATAGWGSKLKPDANGKYNVEIKKGEVLSRDQADKIARGRIRTEFIPALKKLDPYWNQKNPNQQAAMISYMYQTGSGIGTEMTKDGTQLKKQQYVSAIGSKNWKTEIPKAMTSLKMSNKNMQKGVDARQKALVDLFNKPYNAEDRANLIDQDLTDYPNIR